MDFLVWLLAAYGCASLLVAIIGRVSVEALYPSREPMVHYQLLLYNSEQLLEGVVRRLLFRSFWHGKPICISFVDFGSTDDSRRISQLMERKLEYMPDSCQNEGETVTIDLRQVGR